LWFANWSTCGREGGGQEDKEEGEEGIDGGDWGGGDEKDGKEGDTRRNIPIYILRRGIREGTFPYIY
jgi:hypothetical protein